jgi:hypothetical protein
VYIWLVSGTILFPVEIGSDNGGFVIWDKNRAITGHLSGFAWFLSCIPAKNNHDLRFNYVKPTIVILPTDYPHNGHLTEKKKFRSGGAGDSEGNPGNRRVCPR